MPLPEITLRGEDSRARELYAVLHASILDGTVRPGERIVEEAIASLASVSRTPVREAIRRLQADGLVEHTAKGLVVVGMDLDELGEMCVVREVLEGVACQLAAQLRSDIDITTLRLVTARWQEAVEAGSEPQELVELNHAFHEIIWRAANNDYLRETLEALRARIERAGPTTLNVPGRSEEVSAEHSALLDAIARHDGDEAFAIGRAHFRRAMALRLAHARYDALREHMDNGGAG